MSILHNNIPVLSDFLFAFAAMTTPVITATIHVDATATATTEDGSETYPYNTIQEGLNAAVEGDEVLVAPGIYYGAIELVHNVRLVSSAGPGMTVIDCMGASQVVLSPYHTTPSSYIEGFTLRNGRSILIRATNRVRFWQSSSMTVSNCILEGEAGQFEIGISNMPSAAVAVSNTLFKNLDRY